MPSIVFFNRNSISFWNEMSYHDNECYELIEAKETIFVKKMCENLEGSLNYPFWLYLNGYGPLAKSVQTEKEIQSVLKRIYRKVWKESNKYEVWSVYGYGYFKEPLQCGIMMAFFQSVKAITALLSGIWTLGWSS